MRRFRGGMSIAGAILLLATLPACNRAPGEKANSSDNAVREDMKQVARATEKTAKDIGHAAVEATNRAGQGISEAGDKVGAGSRDAWITTKVKSELTSKGFDPLRVYVDTHRKVVTLSFSGYGALAGRASRCARDSDRRRIPVPPSWFW